MSQSSTEQTDKTRFRWFGLATGLGILIAWLTTRTIFIEVFRGYRWGPLIVGIVMQVLFTVVMIYCMFSFGMSGSTAIRFDVLRRHLLAPFGVQIRREGKRNLRLVGVGFARAYYVQTDQPWDIRKMELPSDRRIARAINDGWQVVGEPRRVLGFFPPTYFVRPRIK
jgi:hypothetical protein